MTLECVVVGGPASGLSTVPATHVTLSKVFHVSEPRIQSRTGQEPASALLGELNEHTHRKASGSSANITTYGQMLSALLLWVWQLG